MNDAIEAAQYAIWRYTDLGFDAAWNWETPNSEAVYWRLDNGANAAPSPVPFPTVATATITAPSTRQTAGSLVGPFTVSTNQALVGIDAQGVPVTDAQGTPITPSAVTNGQAVYLDLRTQKVAGTATITVTAAAAGPTGNIISVATPENTEPSADAHAQSIVLVQARTATTRAQVAASWFAAQATEPTAGGSTPTSGPGTTAGPNATAAPGASSAPAGAVSTSDASRAGAQNARLASTGESFPALALGIAVVLLALGLAARRIRGSRRDA
ncbi:thioester domain-containing protein [Mycetocola saprophilus]|uniref:thioester domain-containing protein n=1 Tax=Mycetocola saprophilus TaxID=76636 RepID=UPI0004C09C33|nr:thioester domain-containing protein [Mycetocola saprophilus]